MKVKVSEAEGPVLDWMVATCVWTDRVVSVDVWPSAHIVEVPVSPQSEIKFRYEPSTNWAQGGPIIEREFVTLAYLKVDGAIRWEARKFSKSHTRFLAMEYGPTPLTAAMRCYVASKLGDEVDVPEVLCEEP